MATEVATAYVTLLPTFKGVSKTISKELGDTAAVRDAGAKAGGGWVASIGKWAKRGTILGVGATLGTAITAGFSRAIDIQNATKKLEGLGYSSKAVANISNDALGSVKGTAFGMGEAMNVAASAVAAGVKPGKDLQGTLGLVADAATIGGTSMSEMGGIFNKVAASGKMQTDVANQLVDRGIPIWQFLGETMGKTQGEVQALASAGKIDFATFQKAMEHGLGGAAAASGKTFTGSLKNVVAAMGRLGAMFAGPIVNNAPKVFQALAGAIDSIQPVLQPVADKFAKWLGPAMKDLAGWIKQIDFGAMFKAMKDGLGPLSQIATSLSPIGIVLKGMAPVLPKIGDSLAAVGAAVGGVLLTVLPLVADAFGQIGAALAGAISAVLPTLVPLFEALAVAIGALNPVLTLVVPLVASLVVWLIKLVTPLLSSKVAVLGLVGAFVAWKSVMAGIKLGTLIVDLGKATVALAKNTVAWFRNAAAALASKAQTLALAAMYAGGFIANIARSTGLWIKNTAALVANKVATTAVTVATKAWSVATKLAAVAQRVFNAAMRANPIGLVITAITALVAALVWFFTKTKVGKKIVAAAWKGIKVAIKAVADWWTKTAWPAMKKVITAFGKAFRVAGKIIKIAWNGIKAVMSKVWNWIKKNVLNKFKAGLESLRDKFSAIKKRIGGIWSGLGDKLKAVWAWIQAKVFGKFKGGLDSLREKFANIKKKIGGIWDGLKQKLKDVWEWIRDKVFGKFKGGLDSLREKFSAVKKKIGGIWDGLKQKLADVWIWIKKHVFGPLKDGLKSVKEAFRKQKDGIAVIWNKLKGVAAKPVNFVIGTVYNNGIRKLVNKVFSFLGMDKRLGKLSKVSWDTGGYTGRGGKYDPAGLVHRNEFVVRSESRRRFERKNPGHLDYLNRYGELPGYAKGGSVGTLEKGLRWWQKKGARVSEYSGWGQPVAPVHMKNSLHYKGQAGDLNYGPGGQNSIETAFFDRNLSAFKAAFPTLNALWRVPGHYNHLHLDTGAYGVSSAGGGSGFDFFGIIDKLKALKNKLTGALFDNPIGQFVAGLAKKVIGAPVDWIKEKAGAAVGGVKDAGVSAVVKAVAMKYGSGLSRWGMGAQWDAIAHIIDKESGWDPHAANPASSARGLFQKMTSIHGPIEKSIAGQATWGLNYIKSRYGTPVAAWNHWKKNHSYDSGGWLPAGGIGINQTGKPEAVLTPAQSDGLTHLGEPVDLSRETVLELADAILAGATAVASRETARAARARGSAMRAGVRR